MTTIAHIGSGGGVMGIIDTLSENLPQYRHGTIPFGSGKVANQPGVWAATYNPLAVLRALWTVFRRLKSEKPDIVVLHGLLPMALAVWPARWSGVSRIIAIDHGPQPTFTTLKSVFLFLAARHYQAIVSVSQDAMTWQRQHFPFLKKTRMVVIENGVEPPSIGHTDRPLPHPPFRLVTMARIDFPQKDPLTLIRAAAILRGKKFPFRVDIYGDGNAKKKVRAQIQTRSLSEIVLLRGHDPQAARQLRNYDLVVLSTHWEGLPLSLLEAMAAGIPIVASRVTGVTTLLDNGRLGYLFSEGDPNDLARVILEALTHPETSLPMAAHAQRRVRERYSRRQMIEKYQALFTEAMKAD